VLTVSRILGWTQVCIETNYMYTFYQLVPADESTPWSNAATEAKGFQILTPAHAQGAATPASAHGVMQDDPQNDMETKGAVEAHLRSTASTGMTSGLNHTP
jgi:hypothetical protein